MTLALCKEQIRPPYVTGNMERETSCQVSKGAKIQGDAPEQPSGKKHIKLLQQFWVGKVISHRHSHISVREWGS